MKNFSFLPLAIFPTLLICSLENERHKCLVMKHPENSCSKAINNGEKKQERIRPNNFSFGTFACNLDI